LSSGTRWLKITRLWHTRLSLDEVTDLGERQLLSTRLSTLVSTVEEFDRLVAEALPELLDRATGHSRRFLRETGQWADDISHEKLALRWGYELLERFLVGGRTEVPCRPFFLLDSIVAKYFSQPEPLCYHKDLLSPLGRFLEAITARAVVSRDALMTLFYHLYGLSQSQVVRILGLGAVESQRVYKNFERWRQTGWQRAVTESGVGETELRQIEEENRRQPERLKAEADRLIRLVQTHYRRSEPEHFPCLTHQKWADLFEQDYDYDYRMWHLALCWDCLIDVYDLRQGDLAGIRSPQIDLRLRPLQKGGIVTLFWAKPGGGNGHSGGQSTQHLSRTSA